MLPIAFASPWVLLALATLPIIWWLLRLTPPKPRQEAFPPTRILSQIPKHEETPAHSPWWLVLLRLAMAALVILAMAGPIWNPQQPVVAGDGPVLIIVDNSWASGSSWEAQIEAAGRIVEQAKIDERSVSLIFAAGDSSANLIASSADQAAKTLQAAQPLPLPLDWQRTVAVIENLPLAARPSSLVWLSGGLAENSNSKLAGVLQSLGAREYQIYMPKLVDFTALTKAVNDPAAMEVTLKRPLTSSGTSGDLAAFDEQGRPLATAQYSFDVGENTAVANFSLPVELRNDFARIELATRANAGGVFMLDDRFRRRRVGLVSGEKSDLAQPLLSPLYYISRALGPYSELRYPDDANIATAIPALIEDRISALILADIGTIPSTTEAKLSSWIKKGGMLIRFAGPRLAAASNSALVPVELRKGGRNLAGSLTWGTPQPLTSFNPQSPFSGLKIPDDVTVTRQVLAEPNADLPQNTWASLADGTPLVTAEKRGSGWIILFHVTANASWSNLALSGSFVEMLRRVVTLSGSSDIGQNTSDRNVDKTILPPYRILDGKGVLGAPPANARPMVIGGGSKTTVSFDNPPGQYGSSDGFVVQNLLDDTIKLTALDATKLAGSPDVQTYIQEDPQKLRPWLLAAALILLALDCLAVLWMAGAFARKLVKPGLTALFLAVMVTGTPDTGVAQENSAIPKGIEATLSTRLAYVITGMSDVDEISRRGLIGLTAYISARTSLEPGAPIGIDISKDELSFFPLIYWPIDPDAPLPDSKAMARIDAFMKKGGSVIFDTRDALSGGFGGVNVSDATHRLRQILADLDIPPLERVPSDHVLTKAFYLLNSFPGRFNNGSLWVETSEPETDNNRPVRVGDGVSSIIITSNDLAGAWAVDGSGRPLLPTVPPDQIQRTYAYRVGVNLVMYTLTGNYKSDQVHIPALLERLGQ